MGRGIATAIVICVIAGTGVLAGCGGPSGGTGAGTGATAPASGVYGAAADLTGPITAGHVVEPLSGVAPDLAAYGYQEQEFFASGTAHAFTTTGGQSADGRWTIRPTTSASYRTRILVRRPADPHRFNGTLVVEWMNVSAGESAPDWDFLNPELMRAGYAYVGVSAQAQGVDGGKPLLGTTSAAAGGGLIRAEPARYGTLHHPGDQYALDIFAQVGQALLRGQDRAVLGGLRPHRVVAVGESQSAFYLTAFVDALQPRTGTFDGFFIHSRGGSGAPLNGASAASGVASAGLRIRTDLSVPVFMFETQTDLIQLGYASARQPDTSRIRTWEVAGTSHADAYLVGGAAAALGCTTAINDGPQHLVVQAAFAAFGRWVTAGTPPPSPAPFRLASERPAVLALDAHGNVVGGVRTPAVDVPVSTLSGAPPPKSTPICGLFGSTVPFGPAELVRLYRDRATYLARYTASLDRAIASGFILSADRPVLLAQAEGVALPAQ
jgi:hypothetical protein